MVKLAEKHTSWWVEMWTLREFSSGLHPHRVSEYSVMLEFRPGYLIFCGGGLGTAAEASSARGRCSALWTPSERALTTQMVVNKRVILTTGIASRLGGWAPWFSVTMALMVSMASMELDAQFGMKVGHAKNYAGGRQMTTGITKKKPTNKRNNTAWTLHLRIHAAPIADT